MLAKNIRIAVAPSLDAMHCQHATGGQDRGRTDLIQRKSVQIQNAVKPKPTIAVQAHTQKVGSTAPTPAPVFLPTLTQVAKNVMKVQTGIAARKRIKAKTLSNISSVVERRGNWLLPGATSCGDSYGFGLSGSFIAGAILFSILKLKMFVLRA